MNTLDKCALKFQSRLSKAAQEKLPSEVRDPLLQIIQKLNIARQEALKGNSAEIIATNLVDSADAISAYRYQLKSKERLKDSLKKLSMEAFAPLNNSKRGTIAGGVSFWITHLKRAADATGQDVLKYFSEHPSPPQSQVSVSKIKTGPPKISAQQSDLTGVLYKSGILGWQSGVDLAAHLQAPPLNLRSNTANKIFSILDSAKSDGLSATINVNESGITNVNVTVKGGNQAKVVMAMKRYFDPKMTKIIQTSKLRPAGAVTLKWIDKIGYKA